MRENIGKILAVNFSVKVFPGEKRWGGEIGIFQNQLEIRVRELITAER